ncbi:hypothetical protein [Pseudonocardia sp. HH130629-09]|uniref:hypothetical protein n=1 Tax=Pseudonocardia sp. HH130629-09 TaxID=1641402 RepID=UPI0006CB5BF6|nr:hypothetical protein [Pseudonocardia sp. HH130629-09]ALE82469.1 hypothetical protein XF36_04355 [Pseudonocardia sp. HH130629-09]
MNAELISALLALAAGVLAVRWWRHARRIAGALVGVVAVGAALVAIRNLPEPVVVATLLAALGVVAVVTAWPWLSLARRAGERTEADR